MYNHTKFFGEGSNRCWDIAI